MSKDENWANRGISFYTKGLLVGMCLDMAIRERSRGKASLDDAMRTVYRDTRRKDYAGLTGKRFRAACEAAAGSPLPEIFDEILPGTDEIDFDEWLGRAGHSLKPDWPKRGRLEPAAKREGFIGAEWETREGRVYAAKVPLDTPALASGLLPGDEVLFLNGRRVESVKELSERIRWTKPGDTLRLVVSRYGRMVTIDLIATRTPPGKWKIVKKRNRSLPERKLGEAWLGERR
jgi:predicted metalloprotease with PDZ domain